ncbi:MAG: LPS export ABC transporter periplasmic protein LptC [Nitrospirae bacterium]|jgi:LPS export ABC transporter protein LptC|nr:LPS export ABC transporter periplasmic protein LptC [Nitrospirota bacterium]
MKRVLLIGLSVLLFGILFVMLRTGREDNGNFTMKGESFLEDIRIIHKEDGISIWTLTANKAEFIEGGDKAELNNITMAIPKNDVILFADRGIYSFSEHSFTTDGVVKAESKDYKITADSIDYEISSGRIKTDGRIILETKGFNVEGIGMRTEPEEKVSILNDVKAIFHR